MLALLRNPIEQFTLLDQSGGGKGTVHLCHFDPEAHAPVEYWMLLSLIFQHAMVRSVDI